MICECVESRNVAVYLFPLQIDQLATNKQDIIIPSKEVMKFSTRDQLTFCKMDIQSCIIIQHYFQEVMFT